MFMETLIWIDWVIIALITVSTVISLKRGFVKEALSLVTWIGAFIIARTFHPQMQSLLESSVETPLVRLIAAFAILFFGDRKSTRLNSSHVRISYAVFCLKKKKN